MAEFIPIRVFTGEEGEYYNLEDYERLLNNIEATREAVQKVFLSFVPQIQTIAQTRSSIPNDNVFRAIENALIEIQDTVVYSFIPFVGNPLYWTIGGRAPDYRDFNRWEQYLFDVYTTVLRQYESLNTLPMILGGVQYV